MGRLHGPCATPVPVAGSQEGLCALCSVWSVPRERRAGGTGGGACSGSGYRREERAVGKGEGDKGDDHRKFQAPSPVMGQFNRSHLFSDSSVAGTMPTHPSRGRPGQVPIMAHSEQAQAQAQGRPSKLFQRNRRWRRRVESGRGDIILEWLLFKFSTAAAGCGCVPLSLSQAAHPPTKK